VLADQAGCFQLEGDFLLALAGASGQDPIANAHGALEDEVHLGDLILLLVDELVLFGVSEEARHKAEGDVIKHPGVLVLFRVEKGRKPHEDVLEQVVRHDLPLYAPRQRPQVLILRLQIDEAVMGPVVAEVSFDLGGEALGEGRLGEVAEEEEPLLEVSGLVHRPHLRLIVRQDVQELIHYVGEEGHAAEHDEDREELLDVRDGIQVPIAHRRQRRQRKVQALG